jgi:hypothetical protein
MSESEPQNTPAKRKAFRAPKLFGGLDHCEIVKTLSLDQQFLFRYLEGAKTIG